MDIIVPTDMSSTAKLLIAVIVVALVIIAIYLYRKKSQGYQNRQPRTDPQSDNTVSKLTSEIEQLQEKMLNKSE